LALTNHLKKDAGVLKFDPLLPIAQYDINFSNKKLINEVAFNNLKAQQLKYGGTNLNFEKVKPRFTSLLQLADNEADTLKTLSKSTQRKIKIAQKKLITIKEGNRDTLTDFHKIMAITANRNEFGIRPLSYFETM